MKINWKKGVLPHVIAIVVFIVLGFAYCNPVLQGETVNQSDMTQVEGMAHEAKEFYEQTGEIPLWTNSMFGGMPTYLIYTGPSANKVSFLNKLTTLWLPQPVNMLFIAMLGMYFLLCVLGFNYWVRLFGGVGYGFSSYNVILIMTGHITKMMTMAWMGPVLAGVILVYRGKYLLGAIVTAFSTALLIYNNHFQVMYYAIIMIAFLVISQLVISIREKKLSHFVIASLICVGAAILAVLPAMDNLLVTKEYTPYSIRGSHSELTLQTNKNNQIDKGGLGIDYAYAWSFGKLETFSILVPNIFGGPPSENFISNSKTYQALNQMGVGAQQAAGITSQSMYWGPQPFTIPVYFGALICFLFILSFFLVKSKHKWWILAVTLLSILMAWGKNFPALNNFLFYHLPLYNKFRAPSMIMVIPQLTFVWMACWALNEVLIGKISKAQLWDSLKKTLYIAAGIIVFLWIAVATLGYVGNNDTALQQQAGADLMRAIHADRASLMHKDAIRSLILMLILFAALWALIKEKIKPLPFFVIVSILLIFDLFSIDSRYLNKNNYSFAGNYASAIQPTPADQQIMQDKDPDYRVLNLTGSVSNIFNGDAITSYFHKSVGGYSPAKLWRYQDLIDYRLTPEIQRMVGELQSKKTMDSSVFDIFSSSPVLNLLNTKYFIINPNGAPVKNDAALGNAWFVSNIQWAPNADSEMVDLGHFNPEQTVIISESYKSTIPASSFNVDSAAHIQLTQYSLNNMKYESNNAQKGLGVFSEIYYPAGWKAYIDGKETPILRVNYAFRGLEIPAGKHAIEFKFHPKTFFTGQKISSISSLVLILLVLAGLAYELFKRAKQEPPLPDIKAPVKPKGMPKKK